MSKKNEVFVEFDVNAPFTVSVPVTFAVVTFERVATTFVVVSEFETTRFTKGWVMTFELMFERRPPSPVIVPGNVAAPDGLNDHVCAPTARLIGTVTVCRVPEPKTDVGRDSVPSVPYVHTYDPTPRRKGFDTGAFTVPVVTVPIVAAVA